MRVPLFFLLLLLLSGVDTLAQPNCSAPTTGFIPINDLKTGTFNGWKVGMTTSIISTPNHPNYANYWSTVSGRLSGAGVTSNQVQIIWYKEANVANGVPLRL